MLYLHCGWPRTSTTSLQAALFEHKEELAASGIVYPDRWRSPIGLTHHGLSEILSASLESESAFDEFRQFLETQGDRDVLFSAEALTGWLKPGEKLNAFLELLSAARESMPTRCIWTLRRRDELVRSVYLVGLKLRPRGFDWPINPNDAVKLDAQFAGHRGVEEAVDGDVVYVQYDRMGAHHAKLLDAFGIDPPVAARIGDTLARAPRLHAGLTHKQFVVLGNIEALSLRAGVSLDEAAIRNAFRRGDFEFERDWSCEWTVTDWQKATHEVALDAARRHGITAYVEFFENAELDGRVPSERDTNAITDDDLRCLAELSAQQR